MRPLVVLSWIFLGAGAAAAQGDPPQIWYVYPAGGQQATEVEITVRGRFLVGATDIRVSGGGVSGDIVAAETKKPEDKKKKRLDASEFNDWATVKLTIAADAPVGERDLRIGTPGGVSNRFRFYVDQIPEVIETEPNSCEEQAQPIGPLPAVVNGQIFQADADHFNLHARAGQTLVFQVLAQSIVPFIADAVPGWFQPTLSVFDSTGEEIAFCDDVGHRVDPLIVHKFEEAGEYRVELKDALYRGRDDFVYRLRIGELPLITRVFPLGGKAGTETAFHLSGPHLAQNLLKVALPSGGVERLPLQASGGAGGPLLTSPWNIAVGPYDDFLETEPNDNWHKAQTVAVPIAIHGRIDSPGDVDRYVFSGKAGERLVFETHARRLGSPVDTVLSLFDPRRKRIAGSDDYEDPEAGRITHHADSRFAHTLAEDGDFAVTVTDLQGHGGDAFAYRLTIAPPNPGFRLRVRPDAPRAPKGGGALVTVTAFRRDGFQGPIALKFDHLPPGLVAPQAVIPANADQTVVTISVAEDASTGLFEPRVAGTAQINGKTVTRVAQGAEELMQAFYHMHSVPSQEFLLSVVEPGPFSVALAPTEDAVYRLRRNSKLEIRATVKRKEGANGVISFSPQPLPKGIRLKAPPVKPGETEATITVITQGPQVKVGQAGVLVLSGVMRRGKESTGGFVPGIPYEIVK